MVLHPITCKEQLILRYHWPLHTEHDIDPGRVFRFDLELWIRTILAATIGDTAIYNGNLSVVTKIQATLDDSANGIVNRQRNTHLYTGLMHCAPQRRLHHCSRPKPVRHCATRYTALRRSDERVRGICTGLIIQPNVIEHVHMINRAVDVLDQSASCRSCVRH